MKIGLLSDTHGVLPAVAFDYLTLCDQIWHAGDIGSLEVVEQLERCKPCKIVYGNIDGGTLRTTYPHTLTFVCEEMRVCLTHITGNPSSYNNHVRHLIQTYKPQLLVGGHSHILRIERDQHGILYLNPGAIGDYGIHKVQTMLRFDIEAGKVKNMEAIELGKRQAH